MAIARRTEPDRVGRPLDFVQGHRQRFVNELIEFVRIPSVSAQPRHAGDVQRCAGWLAHHLGTVGLEHVRVVRTARHPIVCADWRHAAARPTVLIYGHYDVQPADRPHEWITPPFEPAVRGNDLFGRGACDDKGQMFAHVKAIEACLRSTGRLPVNVQCVFEGEEEIGSPNLPRFLELNRRTLAAHAAVMSDTRMLAPDRPAITYSLRGSLNLELEVRGPGQELHSGNFGGAVHNPLQALCEIVTRLHDARGRIAVPGFYERVRLPSASERAAMARAGPSDATILRDAKAAHGWGEPGYSLYERTTIRPALAVTGIVGGYAGPGVKAVIPARAVAKLNFRLVPDQDPHEIARRVREHVSRVTPATVRSAVRVLAAARPAVIDRRHPALRAAARAYRQGFGALPVLLRSGGTIPIVNMLQERLGIPTVLMGFALPDDRIHAPNEKFHLPNFFNGIATCIAFLAAVGNSPELRSRPAAPQHAISSAS